jgi:hypothetical protein
MSEGNLNDGGASALVDRYMPDASASERDVAVANVREFAAVILRIASRVAREEYETAIRAIRAIRDQDVQ